MELYSIDNGVLRLNLHPGQTAAWNSTARFVFVLSGSQGGKDLALDTPIPTPSGWKLMADIQPGDTVFDERGFPCTVIAVSAVKMPKCYRITFDDGASIVASDTHNWLTQTCKQRKNQARHLENPSRNYDGLPVYTVRTTREIKDTLYKKRGEKEVRNHSVDLVSPVQYPYKELPIPPYTFGAWLGDGHSSSAVLTCSDEDYGIVEQINKEGIRTEPRKSKDRCPCYALFVARNGRRKEVLRNLGVLDNKHIPDIYLTASAEQRLELLRGLMDTDGYCGSDKTQCEYTSTNEILALGVVELCRSLGIKARIKHQRATLYGRDVGPKYRVFFTTPIRVFHLERKAINQVGSGRPDILKRYFDTIEPVKSVPCKCISVDSPRNLYLAGKDYIVTHNTSFIPFWMFREIYGLGDYKGQGSGDYLAVSSTYDLFKLKFLPEMLKVFVDLFKVGKYYAGDKFIQLKNPETGQFDGENSTDPMWGRLILRSADSKGGLESSTAKAAAVDECGLDSFSLENWESIQSRLALSQGRVLATTTLYNLGWIKTEVFDQWSNGNKDYDVIQFNSSVNPAFSKEEYNRLKSRMTESKFAMRYMGQFAKPSGMIYKDFSDQMLVDPFPVPSDWYRVIGLDFGGANTCKLWMAENPDDNRWYIYDCSVSGDLTTREHVEETREALADIQEFALVGGSPSETQQRIDWIDNGLDVLTPSISNVEAGIDRVIELLKTDRIRVFRNLRGIRDEFGRYSRGVDSDGEPTHIIMNKRKFHRLDALRYAAVHITDSDYDIESGNLADMMARLGQPSR